MVEEIQQTQTDQKSALGEKIKLSFEKRIRTWTKRVTSALSITNASMSFIVNSINFIIRPIVAANVMLSNIGISVFFNAISFALNMHSFVNHFREKNILKKFNVEKTPEEKRRSRNKLQCICLDLLCDMLFFTSAVTSMALFGNPIALFVSIPLLGLGGLVMTGSIIKSTINQVQEFNSYLLQPEGQEKKVLYQKEIKSSRVYRIMSKLLPNSVVLAKWHAQQEDKREKMIIKSLIEKEKTHGQNLQHEGPVVQELNDHESAVYAADNNQRKQDVILVSFRNLAERELSVTGGPQTIASGSQTTLQEESDTVGREMTGVEVKQVNENDTCKIRKEA